MRKWLIILLAMLFAFTACQQALIEPESKDTFDPSKICFNLSIQHPDGTTKGVKNGWEDGDKVFIFISGNTDGYLIATRSNSVWSTAYVGTTINALGTQGTLHAVYLPYGNDAEPTYNETVGSWSFNKGTDTYYFYAHNEYEVKTVGQETVLSARIQMQNPGTYVQFFIPHSGATETIQLACNALCPAGFASMDSEGNITENNGNAGAPINGYPDTLEGGEGYYVSGKPKDNPGLDYYFALKRGESYSHYYKRRDAIIEAPKAYKLASYTDWPLVGSSRYAVVGGGKWETVNEGADYPWEMGTPQPVNYVSVASLEVLPMAYDWENLENGATWTNMSIWNQNGSLIVSSLNSSNFLFLPWDDTSSSHYWIDGFTSALEITDTGSRSIITSDLPNQAYVRTIEKLNWFKIIAKADGTITREGSNALEYSIDGGDWQAYTSPINVTSGQEVAFRSEAKYWNSSGNDPNKKFNRIRPNFAFDVAGDLTSLLLGDKFGTDQASVPTSGYTFVDFFNGSLVEDASKLLITMTSIPSPALKSFFDSCPNLVAGPAELPATTLNNQCYRNMFKDCPSLTSAPIIRRASTHNGSGWYQQMFKGCTSLTKIEFYDVCEWGKSGANFTNWVDGVNASGDFYKSSSMTNFGAAGASSIPSGWTVHDE